MSYLPKEVNEDLSKMQNELINKTFMDKYYTPTIEEFHVGFEYEYNSDTQWLHESTNRKWKKKEYYPSCSMDGESDHYEIESMLSNNEVRVKHLDREDIESLGAKHDNNGYYYFDVPHTENSNEYFDLDGNLIAFPYWTLHYAEKAKAVTIIDFHGDSRINGIRVKNKSELKRILTQLGVIT